MFLLKISNLTKMKIITIFLIDHLQYTVYSKGLIAKFPASQSLTIPLSGSVKINKNVMIIICIVSRHNWAGEAWQF